MGVVLPAQPVVGHLEGLAGEGTEEAEGGGPLHPLTHSVGHQVRDVLVSLPHEEAAPGRVVQHLVDLLLGLGPRHLGDLSEVQVEGPVLQPGLLAGSLQRGFVWSRTCRSVTTAHQSVSGVGLEMLHLALRHEAVDDGDVGLAGELLQPEGRHHVEGVVVMDEMTELTSVHLTGPEPLSTAARLEVVSDRLLARVLDFQTEGFVDLSEERKIILGSFHSFSSHFLGCFVFLLFPQFLIKGKPVAPVAGADHP